MGLLDDSYKKLWAELDDKKKLSDFISINGDGSNHIFGGRVGLKDIPIIDNISASGGVSGYYSPQYNQGQFNTYDAMLKAYLGKNKQHEFSAGGSMLNTPTPEYRVNYKYNF